MMETITEFRGELAALGAAWIWAIASVIYVGVGRQIPSMVLNLTKGLVAIALILLTLRLRGDSLPGTTPLTLGLLVGSGIIGIGIGDTAFFEALNSLGARRALLMEALAPPLTTLLALVLLSEMLDWRAYLGIVLTVAGVAWVIVERTPNAAANKLHLKQGIGFGLVAALCQALGSVMSRAALADSAISPLWSSLIRLAAGSGVLVLWLAVQRQHLAGFKPLRSPRLFAIIASTAFASTFLAIWLQQTALKFTAAGIAQALSATSPLFVLPIAALLGDRVSLRAVAGVLIALGGIWLLFS
ncbi:MAG: DMT family transporter [Synechococcales bacterium]|nr:DMT family transporter [Synechococcales bacterium]